MAKETGLDRAPIEFWKLVFLVPPIGVVLITGSIEFKAMFPCWWFEKGDKVERMMQIVKNSTQNWIFGILRETKSYLQPTIDHFFPTTCHKVWNTAHTSRGEFSEALRKILSKISFFTYKKHRKVCDFLLEKESTQNQMMMGISYRVVLDGIKCKHCQRHNGPEGWVHLAKVTSWGYITNLDHILSSESRLSIN